MRASIKLPKRLIADKLVDDCGNHCAVGWLATQLGIPVAEVMKDGRYDLEYDKEVARTVADRLHVSYSEVMRLQIANDRVWEGKRIQELEEWLMTHHIPIERETT
jgi:hypothetical protein